MSKIYYMKECINHVWKDQNKVKLQGARQQRRPLLFRARAPRQRSQQVELQGQHTREKEMKGESIMDLGYVTVGMVLTLLVLFIAEGICTALREKGGGS